MKEDIQRQQREDAQIFEEELRLQQERRALGFTTHFTCLVLILFAAPLRITFEEELHLQQERRSLSFTTQFTCFTSTKLQILTHKTLRFQQERRALGFTTHFT